MEPELVEYLAAAVLRDIRAGAPVPAAVCRAFFRQGPADVLRRLVSATDVTPTLALLAPHAPDDVFRLGAHVLQGASRDGTLGAARAAVGARLEALWDETLTVAKRISLLFTLLDLGDVPPATQERLYAFAEGSWPALHARLREWSGGPAAVLATATARVADPRFPPCKRWLYVLTAAAAGDTEPVREFCRALLDDADPLVRRAARDVPRLAATSPPE